ncbi:class I SAM-dependent methyltransferase [soil metagenome]
MLIGLAAGSAVMVAVNLLAGFTGGWVGAIRPGLAALVLVVSTTSFYYATRRGKFVIWRDLLDDADLATDAAVIDLGCGRGAVLCAAAQRVPRGRAVGVDLWRSVDQSGNEPEVATANAAAAGVANRVTLETADLRELPFDDASFDAAFSSLAIHNIKDPGGRTTALEEAVRVVRPGGLIVIADIEHAKSYATHLAAVGCTEVTQRSAGWRGWFGGPWMITRVVQARTPSAG